jgi:hypothetical protein
MRKDAGIVRIGFAFILLLLATPSFAQQAGQKEVRYGSEESIAEVHGFININYFDFQHDHDPDLGVPKFDLHDFYLSARAKINPYVAVFGEIEVEQGTFKLDQGYLEWQVAFPVTLRFGKFFVPFGINKGESVLAPLNKLVSVPLPLTEILYEDWPDIGVEAYGILGRRPVNFSYDIALIKGPAGFTESDVLNTENNQSKMPVGRVGVILALGEMGSLNLGGSAAYGKYDDANRNIIRLFGGDARLKLGDLDLRGELIARNGTDATAADSCGGTPCTPARAHAHGYYIQASYKILKDMPLIYSLEPVVRYDRSDFTDHGFPGTPPDLVERRWTFGLNWSPYDHVRFKAEYQFTTETGASLRNDGVMLAAVADF